MAQSTPIGPRTVLVVDDEAVIRIFLAEIIAERGFIILEATNADEAIGLLEHHPEVEIVVTDVQMPGSMDGVKLSHFIRDRWPPTTLIVISGNNTLEETSLPTGAKFIAKPIDTARLFAAMGQP